MPDQVATQARPAATAPRTSQVPAVRDVAMSERGVSLTSLTELRQFAGDMLKGIGSRDTPEVAMVKIQAGAELGVSALRSMSLLTVINGRVGIMGELALALIRRDGNPAVLNLGNDGEGDARCGFIETQRQGGTLVRTEFTMAEAKRAGLANSNTYKGYPDDMLLWRAVGRHARRYWSDVLMGFEIGEAAQEGHGTPPARVLAMAPNSAEPDPLLTEEFIEAEPVTLGSAMEARRDVAVTNQPAAAEPSPSDDGTLSWTGAILSFQEETTKEGLLWRFLAAGEGNAFLTRERALMEKGRAFVGTGESVVVIYREHESKQGPKRELLNVHLESEVPF